MSTEKTTKPQTSSKTNFVPNNYNISTNTLVNILVKKGICTIDELKLLEEQIRVENFSNNGASFVNIDNPYSNRGRFPSLKKKMSKNRWSRKMGTLLFGWKWKKVKKNPQ